MRAGADLEARHLAAASVPSTGRVAAPTSDNDPIGPSVVATIPVGTEPTGVAYDAAKGELFVTNENSGNVSVISDATNTVVASVPVGIGPSGAAYDSANGEVFVTNTHSNYVSVISDATDKVIATIPVGTGPLTATYDAGKGDVFVTNEISANVSVISATTDKIVATVPVGSAPDGGAYDGARGRVFVANANSLNVSVISDTTDTVVATVLVLAGPQAGPRGTAFDAAKGEMFVAEQDADNVSVINDTTDTVVATLQVGTMPTGAAYFATRGDVFVTNEISANVSVINDTTDTVVATVSVGTTPFGEAYDAAKGEIFVANGGSDNVSVLAFAPPTFAVTFSESGLPSGTEWWVDGSAMGSQSSVTSSVGLRAPNGTYSYSLPAVAGYASDPTWGRVTVQGSAVEIPVSFAPVSPSCNGTTAASGATTSSVYNLTLPSGHCDYLWAAVNGGKNISAVSFTPDLAWPIPGSPYANYRGESPFSVIGESPSDHANFTSLPGTLYPLMGGVAVSSAPSGHFVFAATNSTTLAAAFNLTRPATVVLIATSSNDYAPSIGAPYTVLTQGSDDVVDGILIASATLPAGSQSFEVTSTEWQPYGSLDVVVYVFGGFTVTFTTNPTTCGSITFNGTTYTTGQSVNVIAGTYGTSATACPGYSLQSLSGTGSVSVAIGEANVSGPGGVTATFAAGKSGAPIAVGTSPGTPIYADGQIFVPDFGSASLTVVSGTTDQVVANITVGNEPGTPVYDPVTQQVFVPNFGSNNVSVVSAANERLVTTVVAGTGPETGAYDPSTGDLYFPNAGSGNVTVISGTDDRVVADVSVGTDPQTPALDPVNGELYVANNGSDTVSVVSAAPDLVVATVPVGSEPGTPAVDPANQEIFVPNWGSDNVSVISGSTNTVVTTIGVGSSPFRPIGSSSPFIFSRTTKPRGSPLYDPLNGQIYVPNANSDNVSVINGTSNRLAAAVAVGSQPEAPVLDPVTGHVLVANNGSANVSVISGTSPEVVASILTGANPAPPVFDNASGALYVPSTGSANLTVVQSSYYLTFTETGLPSGAPWQVDVTGAAGSSENLFSRTTVPVQVYNGPARYTIFGPKRYQVTGSVPPTAAVEIAGADVVKQVLFVHGPTRSVTFHETGLPKGVSWCVAFGLVDCTYTSKLAFANVTPYQYPYALLPIPGFTFEVASGGHRYATPPEAVVNVTTASVTVTVKFTPVTYNLTFAETGLPSGKGWTVRISWTYYGKVEKLSRHSTGSSVVFEVPNGTVSYTVEPVKGYVGNSSGSVTVNGAPATVPSEFVRK